MKKEFWITAGLSGLVALFAFFFFVIWRPILTSQEVEKGNNTIVKIDQKTAGKEEVKLLESGMTINNLFIQDAEMPKEPEFKPFFDKEKEKISETFLERFSALAKPLEIASPVPVTTPPAPEEESKASSSPKKTLTDEEWFKIAYPEPVITALGEIEEAMKLTGFISESEKFEFTSDEKIRAFWHKVIDWALKEKMIDEERAKEFRDGIDVIIPQLQKDERSQYEQNLSIRLLNLIFAKLTKIASAQGDCYREGSSSGSGYNTWAMCCNCGYYQKGKIFIWYNDCDYGYCNVDLGCKNLMCESGPVIYDDASGICGCG